MATVSLPGAWTQSIQPTKNILDILEGADVLLRDEQGKPFAVLVSVERYQSSTEKAGRYADLERLVDWIREAYGVKLVPQ